MDNRDQTPHQGPAPGKGGVASVDSEHAVRDVATRTRLEVVAHRLKCNRALLVGALFLPVFAAIHLAAYWLRFDGLLTDRRWIQLAYTLAAVLVIKSVVFGYYRIYQGWSRYATFFDLVTLTKAATLSAGCLALYDYLFLASLHTPRAVFFTDWGATIVVVGGLRSLRRWVNEGMSFWEVQNGVPALIVGADDNGEGILRSIRRNKGLKYKVVGFVAEHEVSMGVFIGGVPVVGHVNQTVELARQHQASELLIASSSLSGKVVRKLVEESSEYDITVKILPSYDQILRGHVNLQPRTVSIADLLRREPVQLDTEHVSRWLSGQTILVTGAAGSIGSEICRQLLPFCPSKLIAFDRSENSQFFLEKELRTSFPDASIHVCIGDIADHARMEELFRVHRPDVVFHAAAYKHVPLMEVNCSEAIKNIPLVTKELADLAHAHDVKSFVMISTDKAVNPTSVMGCSKRVAEIYVQALSSHSHCRFVTVRFGNVLGSNGSVVPVFAEQIARSGPVTVTHPDMQRYFMMIPEASQLVIQAGAMGNGGEIFVLDMGEPVRILDLAQDMIRLSGLRVGEDIEIQFTGVRPGEKLFEELHIHGEQHLATTHPKIMVAKSQRIALDEITQMLQRVKVAAGRGDEEIVAELKRIVPEFVPTRFSEPSQPSVRKAA